MAQDMLHSRPEFGRTFTTALWALGTVAGVQVLAAAWAVITRPLPESAPHPAAPVEIAGAAGMTSPSQPPIPAGEPETRLPGAPFPPLPDPLSGGSEFSPPAESPIPDPPAADPLRIGPVAALGDSLMPGPRYDGPKAAPPLSTLLTEAALGVPPGQRIPDPEVSGLIDTGAERRASGNMQGALDSLRQAEALLPEHPRVLAEIAATYAEMGLDAKASLYWERVRDLGPEAAGAWHRIALGELSGQRAGSPLAPPILTIGKIGALHDPAIRENQGERVVLSVSILAGPQARPSPAEMSMLVYFYDLVDGEKTEASTADTAQNFVSPPYDWQTAGVETIEVIYHQPVFSAEQKRELGVRAYYGYIVELYYRDELQDTAAFPPDLRNLDPGAPPSPLTEAPLGPENSLFPTAPKDE